MIYKPEELVSITLHKKLKTAILKQGSELIRLAFLVDKFKYYIRIQVKQLQLYKRMLDSRDLEMAIMRNQNATLKALIVAKDDYILELELIDNG